MKQVYCVVICVLLLSFVAAQENVTENSTLVINDSSTILDNTTLAPAIDNATSVVENSSIMNVTGDIPKQNQSVSNAIPTTTLPVENVSEVELVVSFELVSVTPSETEVGDTLLELTFHNNGTIALSELTPVVVGSGFSTIDVTPIKLLKPNQTDISFVSGQFSNPGIFLLTIKVRDQVLRRSIRVIDSKVKPVEDLTVMKADLSNQLETLRANYKELDTSYRQKKDSYDVSNIDLTELKKLISSAETALIQMNLVSANASIIQAQREFADQKAALESVQKIGILKRLRDNIIPFSAIAGAIITLFSFYELMKKKQQHLSKKISEVTVTKIVRFKGGEKTGEKTTTEGKTTEEGKGKKHPVKRTIKKKEVEVEQEE